MKGFRPQNILTRKRTQRRINLAGGMFLDLIEAEILEKKAKRREGTAANYCSALSSFRRFLGGGNIDIRNVDGDLIAEYEDWLLAEGACRNTTSFYMRILRTVYNRGVRRGLTFDNRPFDRVYTGVAKTRKRAITVGELRQVKEVDLCGRYQYERSRDMFMLSFYCMGMAFVDLCLLKKSDLQGGRISYQRAKTGQRIEFRVSNRAMTLIQRYKSETDSPFLLNLIRDYNGDVRRQYRNVMHDVNVGLKRVGEACGLTVGLTTYTARHTWASIARLRNVRISTISEALGHEKESTTHIYLAFLDTGSIDRANAMIQRGL